MARTAATTAATGPQTVRVSSKRQITIPAKLYKKLGFAEYAWIEETEDGLLVKPLKVENEDVSLAVLRQLVDEGLEGDDLVERYRQVCPRVVNFQDLVRGGSRRTNREGGPGGGSDRSIVANVAAAASAADTCSGDGRVEPSGRSADVECERVRDVVARAAAQFPAIRAAYLFGSFARGEFSDESDVDVRIEYDSDGSFRLRELAQFQKRIERGTGRNVDVVSARHLKNEGLARAIEREKVLVYEREEQ